MSTVTRRDFLALGAGSAATTLLVSAQAAPTISAVTASAVTQSSATLSGTINPNGISGSARIEWGTDTTYGTSGSSVKWGGGRKVVSISSVATGLLVDTTYHARITVTASNGTFYGPDSTFQTASPGPDLNLDASETARTDEWFVVAMPPEITDTPAATVV